MSRRLLGGEGEKAIDGLAALEENFQVINFFVLGSSF